MVHRKSNDVSEKHIASIIKAEEYAEQGTCVK
jgi:hypothetical protein